MARIETISNRPPAKSAVYGLTKEFVTYSVLVLIICSGIWIRWYGINEYDAIIRNEEGEYARLAENILDRWEYSGLHSGPQVVHAPLYPLLTSFLLISVGNSELAGRLTSLIMSVILFTPIYLIITKVYRSTTALVGTLFLAFHPYLIGISLSVLSESTYLVFMFWAIYATITLLHHTTNRWLILSGIAWGLAYLTRPEGFIGLLITLLSILIKNVVIDRAGWSRIVTILLCIIGPFLLLAAPYMLYLYSVTGHLRLENKTPIVYTISARMLTDMDYPQAALEIDSNLEQIGPELDNTAFITDKAHPPTLIQLTTLLSHYSYERLKQIVRLLVSNATLPILLLASLGLFRRPWHRTRLVNELYLLAMYGTILAPLLALGFTHARYVTALVPFLLIWAANGTVELARWFSEMVQTVGRRLVPHWHVQAVVTTFIALLIIFLFFTEVQSDWRQQKIEDADLAQRVAGLWLREQLSDDQRIMAIDNITTFYSGGTWLPFPYTTDELRLAYVKQMSPDYLVLHGPKIDRQRPDLTTWRQFGIRDTRATLVYKSEFTEIYRWEDK